MDTPTAILYAAVALCASAYAWILSYHSGLRAAATVARVRQGDCAEAPLERDTLRHALFARVGAGSAARTNLVGLKQYAIVALAIAALGGAVVAVAYYRAGDGLWLACAALAAVSAALLATALATLGVAFAENALAGPLLRKYGEHRARVVGLLDQLQDTRLLNQLARNAATESAEAAGVALADDEPNARLSAASATGTPAPTFSLPLYQLQLRLLQRVKAARNIQSAKEAATYLNNAGGAELFEYLQLNADGDYALLRALLPILDGAGAEMTEAYDLKRVSAAETTSDVLKVVTDDKPTPDAARLNYTAEDLVALRRALDDLLNVAPGPYEAEFAARQAPLARMLYAAPIVLLYFAFKWAILRSSQLLVASAASAATALYVLYYTYFG